MEDKNQAKQLPRNAVLVRDFMLSDIGPLGGSLDVKLFDAGGCLVYEGPDEESEDEAFERGVSEGMAEHGKAVKAEMEKAKKSEPRKWTAEDYINRTRIDFEMLARATEIYADACDAEIVARQALDEAMAQGRREGKITGKNETERMDSARLLLPLYFARLEAAEADCRAAKVEYDLAKLDVDSLKMEVRILEAFQGKDSIDR